MMGDKSYGLDWYRKQLHIPQPLKSDSVEHAIDKVWIDDLRPISPLGENRKLRRKRQFATKITLKQKPLSLGAIMALENLQRMFEDKNENI